MFGGALLLGVLFLFLSRSILQNPAMKQLNYRGSEVPIGAGIIFVPVLLLVWITVFVLLRNQHIYVVQRQEMRAPLAHGMDMMLVLVLGMCLVGFLDDVAGDGSTRGFKGHFTEALRGRFTTGFFKALVGFIVAAAATSMVFPIAFHSWESYGKWMLNAAIVALTANLFNLFDLRPGRALKLYFPLMLLTVGLALRFEVLRYWYVAPALPVIAVAVVLLPGDVTEKRMLGDAGSNVLGAVVGIGLVMGVVTYSIWWRIGILVFVLFLTVLSEKFSFSKVIEGNKVLNWLDELGRPR
jgi:UDP-N-acetylmuramyl pentapeptide phosphotransferase/UDP-N-acetylglucosamine-1-phosphate transferase